MPSTQLSPVSSHDPAGRHGERAAEPPRVSGGGGGRGIGTTPARHTARLHRPRRRRHRQGPWGSNISKYSTQMFKHSSINSDVRKIPSGIQMPKDSNSKCVSSLPPSTCQPDPFFPPSVLSCLRWAGRRGAARGAWSSASRRGSLCVAQPGSSRTAHRYTHTPSLTSSSIIAPSPIVGSLRRLGKWYDDLIVSPSVVS